MSKAEMSKAWTEVDAAWLAERCLEQSGASVADTIASLIYEGRVPSGARLPTVRTLARRMSVSPGTIAAAWGRLREEGLIETRRRGGTFAAIRIVRSWNRGNSTDSWPERSPALAAADPKLQPSLEAAILAGLQMRAQYAEPQGYIIEPLVDAVAPTWPFRPEAWVAVGGGTEGLLLAVEATVPPEGAIAVEQPTSPRVVEIIARLGLRPLPIACDSEGPLPDELARVLKHDPRALLYQPCGHIPLGHAISARRARQLADILRMKPNIAIIEDDGLGPLSSARPASIGVHLPSRTILVRMYGRAYGTDLRVGIIGGAGSIIARTRRHHFRGIGVTSGILQGALAYLVTSKDADLILAEACRTYLDRRRTLVAALRRCGINGLSDEGEGLELWVPVKDERAALARLDSQGVPASPGTRCFFETPAAHHVRIAIGLMPDQSSQLRRLAAIIAEAISTS
ncbi:aminotransferase class I/II-fold pyridoxal phosphate-dependent enzyme [Pseudochelatococcus sp. B33]